MRHQISGRSQRCLWKLLCQQRLCTLTWATQALLCGRNPKSQVGTMPISFQGHRLLPLLSRIVQCFKKTCLLQIHFSNILKQGEPFEELLRQKKFHLFSCPHFPVIAGLAIILHKHMQDDPARAPSWQDHSCISKPVPFHWSWQCSGSPSPGLFMLSPCCSQRLFSRARSFLCQCNQNLCV